MSHFKTGVYPPIEGEEGLCQCARCFGERRSKDDPSLHPAERLTLRSRYILCAICGNKRCPHATDHKHACTNSNEPGQPGSSYQ